MQDTGNEISYTAILNDYLAIGLCEEEGAKKNVKEDLLKLILTSDELAIESIEDEFRDGWIEKELLKILDDYIKDKQRKLKD